MMDLSSLILPLVYFLPIVALILAIVQLSSARKHLIALRGIRRALSTRYVGQFPAFLKEIACVLSYASKEIAMIYDLPAYGYYSNYSDWLSIEHILERKIDEGINVKAIVYGPGKREEMLLEQFDFREQNRWDEWRRMPRNVERLDEFVKRTGLKIESEDLEWRIFLNALLKVFQDTVNMTLNRAEVRETEKLLPVYVWIVDNQKAVFAIPSFRDEKTEFGFVTEDPSLIAALKEMFDRYDRKE